VGVGCVGCGGCGEWVRGREKEPRSVSQSRVLLPRRSASRVCLLLLKCFRHWGWGGVFHTVLRAILLVHLCVGTRTYIPREDEHDRAHGEPDHDPRAVLEQEEEGESEDDAEDAAVDAHL
jgi:hypothetical protein